MTMCTCCDSRGSLRRTASLAAALGLAPAPGDLAGAWSAPVVMGIAGVLLLVLVLLVVLLWTVRRHRRQIDALMARLEELEIVQRRASATAAVEPDEVRAIDRSSITADARSASTGADVLAGKTSYLAAVIEDADPDALSLAERVVKRVHAHLEEALSPAQLAHELNISLRTLERVLAATLQCTPTQLITTMKLREARRLLASGRHNVTEVAYRLGFSSASHFSTRFKSVYRVPPSRFSSGRSLRD